MKKELTSIGPMTTEEKRVMAVFLLTAGLWMGGKSLMAWLNLPMVDDAAIAMMGGILMFIVPSKSRKGEGLLVWRDADKIAWGILLLFGGGTALADAMGQTGLTSFIGERMSVFGQMPQWMLILAVILFFTAMTEMMSNLAVVTAFLPMLFAISQAAGVHPFLLMMPATLAASLAFMLPISTAPNAIVYASGHVTMRQMARTGITLNILGALVLLASAYFILPYVYDLQQAISLP